MEQHAAALAARAPWGGAIPPLGRCRLIAFTRGGSCPPVPGLDESLTEREERREAEEEVTEHSALEGESLLSVPAELVCVPDSPARDSS